MDSNHLLQEIFIRNKKNLGKVATDIVVLDNERYAELITIEKKFLLAINYSTLSRDFIVDTVINKCCFFYTIPREKLAKKSKIPSLVICRQMISYILREFKFGVNYIGNLLNQDHTTIIHSTTTIKNYIDTPQGAQDYLELITVINLELADKTYGA